MLYARNKYGFYHRIEFLSLQEASRVFDVINLAIPPRILIIFNRKTSNQLYGRLATEGLRSFQLTRVFYELR